MITDGTLSFAPGVGSQTIPIAIVDDVELEGDERVIIELFTPVNAEVDSLRARHVLTINDNAGEPAGLRIDKWTLRPNANKPLKGMIQVKGEFNDKEAGVQLENGGGVVFDYDGGTISDTLAPSGFTPARGAKLVYRDPTRNGVFLHRIGGSSRSRFSFMSRRDVGALAGISPMDVSMTSDGFSGGVSIVPVVAAKGSKFNIGKNPYSDPELYVDSLIVKRFPPTKPDKDSIRLTLRFPGSGDFLPETDTLNLTLEFFEITVAPGDWKSNRARTKFTHTAMAGSGKITIKVDQRRRTLSLMAKKLDLSGPDAATPEARIGLGFGDFVKINLVILQTKTAKSGATTFRY